MADGLLVNQAWLTVGLFLLVHLQDDLLTELEELEGQELDEQLLAPSTAAPATHLPSVPTARVPAQVSCPAGIRSLL